MMMAVAGTRASAPFAFGRKEKPTPPWVYLVVGGSVLAHIAGAVWLYNQRYVMPERVAPPPERRVILTMERLPPPPTTETEEPPAPPIPVHDPVVIRDTTVAPSPIPVPDTPPADVVIGTPVTFDPGPVTTVIGTATEPTLPPPPSVIRNPQWVSIPSAAQMDRAYPRRASQAGTGGNATLSCSVTANGSVTGCSVVSQSPVGMGFGDAAMSLSRHFRLSPRTVDGQAVEGARVSIPLTFSLGD